MKNSKRYNGQPQNRELIPSEKNRPEEARAYVTASFD